MAYRVVNIRELPFDVGVGRAGDAGGELGAHATEHLDITDLLQERWRLHLLFPCTVTAIGFYAFACPQGVDRDKLRKLKLYHHQPINVSTVGTQAFLMDYI
jgi:hypothetical protein